MAVEKTIGSSSLVEVIDRILDKGVVEDIKANNYNLDIKNPNKADKDHGNPVELLVKYKKLLAEVAETRDALKEELMAALDRRQG